MTTAPSTTRGLAQIPIGLLKPSPNNPREHIGDITDLAQSMREHGLIQPRPSVGAAAATPLTPSSPGTRLTPVRTATTPALSSSKGGGRQPEERLHMTTDSPQDAAYATALQADDGTIRAFVMNTVTPGSALPDAPGIVVQSSAPTDPNHGGDGGPWTHLPDVTVYPDGVRVDWLSGPFPLPIFRAWLLALTDIVTAADEAVLAGRDITPDLVVWNSEDQPR